MSFKDRRPRPGEAFFVPRPRYAVTLVPHYKQKPESRILVTKADLPEIVALYLDMAFDTKKFGVEVTPA